MQNVKAKALTETLERFSTIIRETEQMFRGHGCSIPSDIEYMLESGPVTFRWSGKALTIGADEFVALYSKRFVDPHILCIGWYPEIMVAYPEGVRALFDMACRRRDAAIAGLAGAADEVEEWLHSINLPTADAQ